MQTGPDVEVAGAEVGFVQRWLSTTKGCRVTIPVCCESAPGREPTALPDSGTLEVFVMF